MPQMPSFGNKDWYDARDRRSLPKIAPPPTYVPPSDKNHYVDSDGRRNYRDQRPMNDIGWPEGVAHSRRGGGSPNRWGEWAPGEVERSYPKSDPKNAAWYKDHAWQSHDKRFVRKAGPPTPVTRQSRPASSAPTGHQARVQSAAAKAGAKAVGKTGAKVGKVLKRFF